MSPVVVVKLPPHVGVSTENKVNPVDKQRLDHSASTLLHKKQCRTLLIAVH